MLQDDVGIQNGRPDHLPGTRATTTHVHVDEVPVPLLVGEARLAQDRAKFPGVCVVLVPSDIRSRAVRPVARRLASRRSFLTLPDMSDNLRRLPKHSTGGLVNLPV
jgi:hypothetical protein